MTGWQWVGLAIFTVVVLGAAAFSSAGDWKEALAAMLVLAVVTALGSLVICLLIGVWVPW